MAKEKNIYPPLYLIEWDDAASNNKAWFSPDDADEWASTGFPCATVGFIVKETEEAITVCMSLAETGARGGLWQVPKGMIKRKKRIKL